LAGGPVKPLVTVHGELHIEGTIQVRGYPLAHGHRRRRSARVRDGADRNGVELEHDPDKACFGLGPGWVPVSMLNQRKRNHDLIQTDQIMA
jgi:hypothetical protein